MSRASVRHFKGSLRPGVACFGLIVRRARANPSNWRRSAQTEASSWFLVAWRTHQKLRFRAPPPITRRPYRRVAARILSVETRLRPKFRSHANCEVSLPIRCNFLSCRHLRFEFLPVVESAFDTGMAEFSDHEWWASKLRLPSLTPRTTWRQSSGCLV